MARDAGRPQVSAAGVGPGSGSRAAAHPVGAPLPDQWTVSPATIAATLTALKDSMAPVSAAAVSAAPAPKEAGSPGAPARPPLPTRRSRREAAERSAPVRGSRTGLFARLLTVRAFRTGHAQARAASKPIAAVGELLDAARVHGVLTLHHRRVPGQRGRIEHLAIGPSGVCVVDVLHFKNATVELRPGSGAGGTVDLVVGGRVMTTAAAATARRVGAVRSILAAAGLDGVPVAGALCFVDGLLPLAAGDLRLQGIDVVRPSGLTAVVARQGSFGDEHRATLHEYLAEALPACT